MGAACWAAPPSAPANVEATLSLLRAAGRPGAEAAGLFSPRTLSREVAELLRPGAHGAGDPQPPLPPFGLGATTNLRSSAAGALARGRAVTTAAPSAEFSPADAAAEASSVGGFAGAVARALSGAEGAGAAGGSSSSSGASRAVADAAAPFGGAGAVSSALAPGGLLAAAAAMSASSCAAAARNASDAAASSGSRVRSFSLGERLRGDGGCLAPASLACGGAPPVGSAVAAAAAMSHGGGNRRRADSGGLESPSAALALRAGRRGQPQQQPQQAKPPHAAEQTLRPPRELCQSSKPLASDGSKRGRAASSAASLGMHASAASRATPSSSSSAAQLARNASAGSNLGSAPFSPPTSCAPQRNLQRARREAAAVSIQHAYAEHRSARSASETPRRATATDALSSTADVTSGADASASRRGASLGPRAEDAQRLGGCLSEASSQARLARRVPAALDAPFAGVAPALTSSSSRPGVSAVPQLQAAPPSLPSLRPPQAPAQAWGDARHGSAHSSLAYSTLQSASARRAAAAFTLQCCWRRYRAKARWMRATLLQTAFRAAQAQQSLRKRLCAAESLVAILAQVQSRLPRRARTELLQRWRNNAIALRNSDIVDFHDDCEDDAASDDLLADASEPLHKVSADAENVVVGGVSAQREKTDEACAANTSLPAGDQARLQSPDGAGHQQTDARALLAQLQAEKENMRKAYIEVARKVEEAARLQAEKEGKATADVEMEEKILAEAEIDALERALTESKKTGTCAALNPHQVSGSVAPRSDLQAPVLPLAELPNGKDAMLAEMAPKPAPNEDARHIADADTTFATAANTSLCTANESVLHSQPAAACSEVEIQANPCESQEGGDSAQKRSGNEAEALPKPVGETSLNESTMMEGDDEGRPFASMAASEAYFEDKPLPEKMEIDNGEQAVADAIPCSANDKEHGNDAKAALSIEEAVPQRETDEERDPSEHAVAEDEEMSSTAEAEAVSADAHADEAAESTEAVSADAPADEPAESTNIDARQANSTEETRDEVPTLKPALENTGHDEGKQSLDRKETGSKRTCSC
eukprot:TRINITY_DN2186_c0_g1_i4.p1 TRINITY_DN2186_c0_g1~~TRINITY_DN2186_c0_g1_i4.p1  ORF type:complete len:1079 (-),score=220.87 TRINITY_DN2186_c0_g1_i4:453-3617(-)